MADLSGKIIEFYDKHQLHMGLVISTSGSKLHLLSISGRDEKCTDKQVAVVHTQSPARAEFPEQARALQAEIESGCRDIDLELLWQGLDDRDRQYSAADLAASFFGEYTAVQQSALVSCLLGDSLYFRFKSGEFQPRTEKFIREEKEKLQRKQEKDEENRRIQAWFADVLEGKVSTADDARLVKAVNEVDNYVFNRVSSDVISLLGNIKGSRSIQEAAVEVLKACGKLERDADRFLVAAGIRGSFKGEILSTAWDIPEFEAGEGVEDWTGSLTFSIDDQDTEEIDDALTLTGRDDGYILGIHVADVSSFISKDSLLDREAYSRSVSLYMPGGTVPMLPPVLSYDRASLNPGKVRPALSLICELDKELEIVSWRFCRTSIISDHRFNYDEVDEWLEEGGGPAAGELRLLRDFSRKHMAARLENGAIVIPRPDMKIRVKDHDISLKMLDMASPSRSLVSESMILYNHLAARLARTEGIPVIFRSQDEARDDIENPLSDLPDYQYSDDYNPVYSDYLIKRMKPSRLTVEAAAHHGLGLDVYTQVSSPLRRFADLVAQRQLKAHLSGDDFPYSQTGMMEVLATAEAVNKEIRMVERKASRFWLLTALARDYQDKSFQAMVTAVLEQGSQVELSEIFVRGLVSGSSEHRAGDIIKVRIDKVDPERNMLHFIEA